MSIHETLRGPPAPEWRLATPCAHPLSCPLRATVGQLAASPCTYYMETSV